MNPGVPVVTIGDYAGLPTLEYEGALSANQSIFAGQTAWQLTFFELVERCTFAPFKTMGFFVLDSARRSISHHIDTSEGQTAAMLALMQSGADGAANGYTKFSLEALGNAPSAPWLFRRADGTLLNASIVDFAGSLEAWELSIANTLAPSVAQLTLAHMLQFVDAALTGGKWICFASQAAQTLTFWAFVEADEVADFTAAVLGNELLDASFGYRAQLTN